LTFNPGRSFTVAHVSTYTIGEIADRTGFTASALRYYEGIGLVVPAGRSDAGYRLYDDHALARLAFINRAKHLGCSLQEITDLMGIWDGERCGPVQRRFHELVTTKIADAQRQIGDLAAFTAQLQGTAKQLSGEPLDGPCGDDCACLGEPAIACTLGPGSVPDRLSEWQGVLEHATARTSSAEGALRIAFDGEIAIDDLARLVAAEHACCAFLSFAITVDARGVALEVRAPEGANDVVGALFGDYGCEGAAGAPSISKNSSSA
jgi:DNA-binding transcriptional MerR regulator